MTSKNLSRRAVTLASSVGADSPMARKTDGILCRDSTWVTSSGRAWRVKRRVSALAVVLSAPAWVPAWGVDSSGDLAGQRAYQGEHSKDIATAAHLVEGVQSVGSRHLERRDEGPADNKALSALSPSSGASLRSPGSTNTRGEQAPERPTSDGGEEYEEKEDFANATLSFPGAPFLSHPESQNGTSNTSAEPSHAIRVLLQEARLAEAHSAIALLHPRVPLLWYLWSRRMCSLALFERTRS